jgi:hypothetical protein
MPTVSSTDLPSLEAVAEIEEHLARALSDVDAVLTALKRRKAEPPGDSGPLAEAQYGRLVFVAADARQVAVEIQREALELEELAYQLFRGERLVDA